MDKFKDQDALQKAYKSLEKEFTRRSQRLREVQGKIDQGTLIEFPRMFKAIDRAGWIVEFIDESGCVCRNHFFHEEKAIERLKELQE